MLYEGVKETPCVDFMAGQGRTVMVVCSDFIPASQVEREPQALSMIQSNLCTSPHDERLANPRYSPPKKVR